MTVPALALARSSTVVPVESVTNKEIGHDRRDSIMLFVEGFIATNGYSPTVREVALGVGLASPGSAHRHLERLVDEGKLSKMQVTRGKTVYVVL